MAKKGLHYPTLLSLTACALFLLPAHAQANELVPEDAQLSASLEKKPLRKSPSVKAAFAPFTGKVSGNKVRMRMQPDLDSFIVRELHQNEYISVVDQEGDFYCITPPDAIKAYIFRSFVLDGVVEGNRVNVRLAPDLEAPVIGHLNSGDRINGKISPLNKKWLEIAPPSNTQFYVSKQFIESVGGPEVKQKMDLRKESVASLLESAHNLAQTEMEKSFEEIDFDQLKGAFMTIINGYADFPAEASKAKQLLSNLQESYLEKRITYLEEKAALVPTTNRSSSIQSAALAGLIRSWETVEQKLYAGWAELNHNKSMEEFYQEQKLVAINVSGTLEQFNSPVRNKPGDFIIKNKNLPVAYVYSTEVDLSQYVGQKVTLLSSPRSNNNFAFPAYFIHQAE